MFVDISHGRKEFSKKGAPRLFIAKKPNGTSGSMIWGFDVGIYVYQDP